MAAKINWRRYGTKLRHCYPVYNDYFLTLIRRRVIVCPLLASSMHDCVDSGASAREAVHRGRFDAGSVDRRTGHDALRVRRGRDHVRVGRLPAPDER